MFSGYGINQQQANNNVEYNYNDNQNIQKSDQTQDISTLQRKNSGKGKTTVDTFKDRREILKEMDIPKSNSECIIVKPTDKAIGYNIKCYNKQFLSHLLDKESFDLTVKQANKIVEDAWIEDKLQETKNYYIVHQRIIQISLFFLLIQFLIMFLVYNDKINRNFLWFSAITFTIVALVVLATLMNLMLSMPKFFTFEELAEGRLKVFLDQQNQSKYEQLGLNWVQSKRYFWLELHIHKSKQIYNINVDDAYDQNSDSSHNNNNNKIQGEGEKIKITSFNKNLNSQYN